MASKKQLKNRSWTLLDRKWTPKVVPKGGPGAVPETTFSALEALLGPNGTKSPPKDPPLGLQEPPKTPKIKIFDDFWVDF